MKFGQWKGKDKWLFLLALGAVFCILAFPAERFFGSRENGSSAGSTGQGGAGAESGRWETVEGMQSAGGETETGESTEVFARVQESYEKELERRVRELLSHVDGVGTVDVMIVLKSSSEKIWQTDRSSSSSVTEETEGDGAARSQVTTNEENATVRVGSGGEETPMLSKELFPEISGIVISADGGGNPSVQREISSAMEALFGLPAHKIKVLKRVE